MNALVQKEIRLLLPSFGIALVLALSVWLVPSQSSPEGSLKVLLMGLPLLLCPALVVMTALDSFGREISSNTFTNLLAQPVSRSRVWWTKTSLLAAALLIVFGVWWLSVLLHPPGQFLANSQDLPTTFTVTVLLLMTAYSGGLWSVLLLRQVGAAFWFTLMAPLVVMMLTAYLTEKFGREIHAERNTVIALIAYSVAGFIWARRLFLRAQDVHWTGGEIGLPAWLKLPCGLFPSLSLANRRPRLALVLKEIQLHQSQLVIAGVLAVVHLAVIVLRPAQSSLNAAPMRELLTYYLWVLWPVMALLIGWAAVAEERKLGTLEAQLCLPVRRRTQFIIKFGVALALAVLFGAVVPALFEGGRILPDIKSSLETMGNAAYEFPAARQVAQVFVSALIGLGPVLPFLPMLVFAVSFVSLAFYSSSLARNTLQAIAPGILCFLIAWVIVMGARFIEDVVPYPLWRGWLIYLIGLPVLTATLVGLTYWNFKRVLVGWPVWRRNLAALALALIFVMSATTAIYQRVWEFAMPLEPVHAPARLTATEATSMRGDGERLSVQFSDGRAWSSRVYVKDGGISGWLLGKWTVRKWPGGGFLPGTNWSEVAFLYRDVVALQRDGSLWVSEQPEALSPAALQAWRDGKPLKQDEIKLVRYGEDFNWRNIANRWTEAFATKNDGTLWSIGTNRFNGKAKWPGLRSFRPRQLGADADWAELQVLNNSLILWKTDGRAYVHPAISPKPAGTLTLDSGTIVEHAVLLERNQWRGLTWISSRRYGAFQVGVADDGTFRIVADYQQRGGKYEMVGQNVQLGTETNWVALDNNHGSAVTLKADGTLWVWDIPESPVTSPKSAKPTRLGHHSDWRAITADAGGTVSLAADGSLWLWRTQDLFNSQAYQPLLRFSRKPQRIGNIFDEGQ